MSERCHITVRTDGTASDELDRAALQRLIDAALARDGLDRCALDVLLVDAARSAELHATHFADPEPTDVMSFPDGSFDPERERRRLGDLAICVDVARETAAERGATSTDVRAELLLYALHGTLHLLGYDDIAQTDRDQMWQLQQELLAAEGIDIES
ncbi:MAG: rRNA maturation RNase YbeY [Planctomycetota bacterium]